MCLPCNSCSRASFGPPESTVQTASRSVQSFLHRSWQPFPICTMGAPFPQNCPFSWVICNTWLLGPIRAHNPNIILIDSSISLLSSLLNWSTVHCWVSLYFTMGCLFPLKIASSHVGCGPPSNTLSLEPTQILDPNSTSRSLQPLLQSSLLWQTNRPTDHSTWSVTSCLSTNYLIVYSYCNQLRVNDIPVIDALSCLSFLRWSWCRYVVLLLKLLVVEYVNSFITVHLLGLAHFVSLTPTLFFVPVIIVLSVIFHQYSLAVCL